MGEPDKEGSSEGNEDRATDGLADGGDSGEDEEGNNAREADATPLKETELTASEGGSTAGEEDIGEDADGGIRAAAGDGGE